MASPCDTARRARAPSDRHRAGPAGPREQPRHEIDAIGRQLEQRLVEQVQVPVLLPDVDDERHRRLDARDVAEVLLRADADVDAAAGAQLPDRVRDQNLIRDQLLSECEKVPGASDTLLTNAQNASSESCWGGVPRSNRDPQLTIASDSASAIDAFRPPSRLDSTPCLRPRF